MAGPGGGGRRGSADRPPQHAGVPDQPVGGERHAARVRFIGDEAAVRVAHRNAIGIEQRVALADLDILVTDAAEQRDGRTDRHGDVGARIFALVPLVELARVLAFVTAGYLPAERQVAGTRAEAGPGDMVGRAVRSAEHTSELQSLMSISYSVFCL